MRSFRALALFLGLSAAGALFAQTVPRPSPEFVINYPGGKQALLSKYRGKVVLLEFIFTTCPHCQATSQMISKLNTELGSKGFQPLAVAVNPMALMLVSDFVRDYHINFPVGASERDPALIVSADQRCGPLGGAASVADRPQRRDSCADAAAGRREDAGGGVSADADREPTA